jgi:hypothetical protein
VARERLYSRPSGEAQRIASDYHYKQILEIFRLSLFAIHLDLAVDYHHTRSII